MRVSVESVVSSVGIRDQVDDKEPVHQLVTAQMLADMGMDWSRIQELAGGVEEFELELLTIFVDDTQLHLDAVRSAISTHNFSALSKEAHHIKGASANVGAVPMQDFATRLEQNAHQQSIDDTIEPLNQLQTWLNYVRTYVYQSKPISCDES